MLQCRIALGEWLVEPQEPLAGPAAAGEAIGGGRKTGVVSLLEADG